MLPIDVVRAADAKAELYKIPDHNLLAVVEVESNGKVFAMVGGKKMPLILFEPHVFARRISGAELETALKQGLASKKWNKKLYPKTQEERWAQLERAKAINREAALESVSYGVGQVLGLHWKSLGFKSIDDFVTEMCSGAEGQIDIMMKFIVKNGLDDELRDGQWAAFARGYNGPAYKKNKYHTRMAAAAMRYAGGTAAIVVKDGMLRMGSRGKRVRELQVLLGRAGFPVKVDSDFGTATRDALKAFQRKHKLKPDGVLGPKTEFAFSPYRQSRDEDIGATPVLEIKEAKEGLGGLLTAGGLEIAQTKVDEATAQLQNVSGFEPWLGYGLTALTIVAAILAVGAVGWGVYGWLKSRKTVEA